MLLRSIEHIQETMEKHRYITDRPLATIIYLSQILEKPILLEGQAGVGKTDVAKVLAEVLETKLIRLQCYEGIDISQAVYEWNYPKQILRIKLEELGSGSKETVENEIFSESFLLKRPLLEAITSDSAVPPVLLIDEIDRADDEFEGFLLEVLSDFQITIPEIGTIKANRRPFVVLTSNRTRELHDALKRRCLYHWIDYPSFEKEFRIVTTKIPGINELLARKVCNFMQAVRQMDFFKSPGIAETLDWATALVFLNKDDLDRDTVEATLGCIFKYNQDIDRVKEGQLEAILEKSNAVQAG
ncbi:MAG: MoxR family ATPase [Chloroflexi bacterium]|nr:MoxR family ATPase [Chloroflexota bacterium]